MKAGSNVSTEPVIVFDGVCLLCSRWVHFVLKHDREGRFRLASMQSPAGRHLLHERGLDPDDPSSFLLVQDGASHTDTDAIARVLRQLGARRWRMVAWLIRITPERMGNAAYRYVARHRYRLFGKSDSCLIPQPDQAHRFLG